MSRSLTLATLAMLVVLGVLGVAEAGTPANGIGPGACLRAFELGRAFPLYNNTDDSMRACVWPSYEDTLTSLAPQTVGLTEPWDALPRCGVTIPSFTPIKPVRVPTEQPGDVTAFLESLVALWTRIYLEEFADNTRFFVLNWWAGVVPGNNSIPLSLSPPNQYGFPDCRDDQEAFDAIVANGGLDFNYLDPVGGFENYTWPRDTTGFGDAANKDDVTPLFNGTAIIYEGGVRTTVGGNPAYNAFDFNCNPSFGYLAFAAAWINSATPAISGFRMIDVDDSRQGPTNTPRGAICEVPIVDTDTEAPLFLTSIQVTSLGNGEARYTVTGQTDEISSISCIVVADGESANSNIDTFDKIADNTESEVGFTNARGKFSLQLSVPPGTSAQIVCAAQDYEGNGQTDNTKFAVSSTILGGNITDTSQLITDDACLALGGSIANWKCFAVNASGTCDTANNWVLANVRLGFERDTTEELEAALTATAASADGTGFLFGLTYQGEYYSWSGSSTANEIWILDNLLNGEPCVAPECAGVFIRDEDCISDQFSAESCETFSVELSPTPQGGALCQRLVGCGGGDADGDLVLDCVDNCPNDPAKVVGGLCGCGFADLDSDNDGVCDGDANGGDECPFNGAIQVPEQIICDDLGCDQDVFANDTGDNDSDGVINCEDACPDNPLRTEASVCGCDGDPSGDDTDSDNDGTPDCIDQCPNDAGAIVPPCVTDECPDDPLKTEPGLCGCGVPDSTLDSDRDHVPDCLDGCPFDRFKTSPGRCGCGVRDRRRCPRPCPDPTVCGPVGSSTCRLKSNNKVQCRCNSGFYWNRRAGQCQDLNECKWNPWRCCSWGVTGTCVNTFGSFQCSCPAGFTEGRWKRCTDINECKADDNICGDHGSCKNTWGSHKCKCDDGYRFEHPTCVPDTQTSVSLFGASIGGGSAASVFAQLLIMSVLIAIFTALFISRMRRPRSPQEQQQQQQQQQQQATDAKDADEDAEEHKGQEENEPVTTAAPEDADLSMLDQDEVSIASSDVSDGSFHSAPTSTGPTSVHASYRLQLMKRARGDRVPVEEH